MPNLHMITRALYVLTDTSIPQPPGEAYKNLSDHAREFMDAIQDKIGAEAYIKLLSAAKKQVGERRQERQRKRRIDAVSHPERSFKEKQRKHDVKKSKLKAKAQLNRERRRAY
ncbi:hypothetical protein MRB53_038815 [Persea americana]|nr:hypothetical protein MRB53_038815 [Persea americana]